VKILVFARLDNCFQTANFWIFVVLRDSRFNWFGIFFICIRACLRMCVWVRFCTWAHQCVRACVHMRRGISDLGPSIMCFPHTTLLQPILFQHWAETSELLRRISSSELDPQPWHFTNNKISFPSSHNSLVCNLYPPSTFHCIRAAQLAPPPPLPKERSCVGRALAPHRLAPHWLHP